MELWDPNGSSGLVSLFCSLYCHLVAGGRGLGEKNVQILLLSLPWHVSQLGAGLGQYFWRVLLAFKGACLAPLPFNRRNPAWKNFHTSGPFTQPVLGPSLIHVSMILAKLFQQSCHSEPCEAILRYAYASMLFGSTIAISQPSASGMAAIELDGTPAGASQVLKLDFKGKAQG